MIDFLQYFFGINEGASILVLILLAAGFVGSFAFSRLMIYTPVDSKTDTMSIVLLAITILLGFASGIPMFMLLITFKMKYLVTALLIAAVVDGLFFGIVYSITFRLRMVKYMRNPVIQEVLSFAKQNNILGIQCFVDGVRFFTALENESYCKSSADVIKKITQAAFDAAKNNPDRPAGFHDYTSPASYAGTIRFSDRGYPDLPDVAFFGKVLAKKLKGFDSAYHTVTLNYDQYGTSKIVHNICHVHKDCFVFKKSALIPLRIKRKQTARADAAAEKQQAKQVKKWE